ncbi:hypothetical protein BDZ91DRAFT_790916 [Kalaharituber pfeilii]|nr:hypothetical protein BDZ91DRAFT_790916 [Kalaharituber pfeilii]
MDYENERGGYEDSRDYPSRGDRSPSPRGTRDDSPRRDRRRSVSPGARARDDRAPPSDSRAMDTSSSTSAQGNGNEARNTGTNLFVTGIHPRLTEDDVTRLFSKYGEVEKCQIMVDPHTKESRGFGFVKMATLEQADAAKEGLQGEEFEGRTLSIEKARRNRPRTPTPGKYFGPPKRDDFRRAPLATHLMMTVVTEDVRIQVVMMMIDTPLVMMIVAVIVIIALVTRGMITHPHPLVELTVMPAQDVRIGTHLAMTAAAIMIETAVETADTRRGALEALQTTGFQ